MASFSFWLKDILNDKNLYQTFVRTIFLGFRLGTQTNLRMFDNNIIVVLIVETFVCC